MNAPATPLQNSQENTPVDQAVAQDLAVGKGGLAEDSWEENEETLMQNLDEEASEVTAIHTENPKMDAVEEAVKEAEDIEADASADLAAKEVVDGTGGAVAGATEKQDIAVSTRNAGRMRWYIIQAHTNFEKKVAASIKHEAQLQGMADMFEEIVVPTEEVIEVRRGRKVQSEKRFFPGYVLAKMVMNDATWQLVNTTDKVVGFLGAKGKRPQPITEAEASAIFKQVEEGVDAPRNTIVFDIGDEVKVVDGPFDSFIGVVDGIDEDRQKLKVSVSIFGRATPVELNFDQVQRV